MRFAWVWTCALILMTSLGHADSIPSIPDANLLEDQIKTYLLEQINNTIPGRIEIEVHPLHASLQQCVQPLQLRTHAANNQLIGAVMVHATCPGTPGWSTYVPTKVKIFQTAVIAARSLSIGAHITSNELSLKEIDISEQRTGALNDPAELLGKQLKRPINAGQIITMNDIKLPLVVHKQELVNVIARVNDLSVTLNAQALDDGALGDLVRVKNLQSNRIVQGIVTGPQAVQIPQNS